MLTPPATIEDLWSSPVLHMRGYRCKCGGIRVGPDRVGIACCIQCLRPVDSVQAGSDWIGENWDEAALELRIMGYEGEIR